jgi:2-oxoglutarate/2-oxoacid ferredoxin oxidoreductase subunit beta
MQTIKHRDDYNSGRKCTWCPGCGNFGIWYMLKQALLELEIEPHNVVIVYDIGCNGNGSNFTHTYGLHGLHGRSIPAAQGIKLANQRLKVIVVSGDGGGLGLGAGHFIHACRRNIDITYLMHDNQIYGLTTGQTSPRSDLGMVTKTSPEGNAENPINPVALSLVSNASFVARTFSGSPHHLKDTLKEAITHKGFSFVDILQPCITFNKTNTYAWYNERIYYLAQETGYDPKDRNKGLLKAQEWGDRIPLGVFHQSEAPTFEESLNIQVNPVDKNFGKSVSIKDALKQFQVE